MAEETAVEIETEVPAVEQPEAVAPAAEPQDEGEVEVLLEGESPSPAPEAAPNWARELRKRYEDAQRELRELKAKQVTPAAVMPAKPTLEGCEYDADRFESELLAWNAAKARHEAEQAKQAEAEKSAAEQWQARLNQYGQAKQSLRVPDFESAESTVAANLSQAQQAIILKGAENPALLVYAIGKSPAKADELAKIQDPIAFAFAVAKLEKGLKVEKRKPPVPETEVRAPATSAGGAAAQLERLEREWEKRGGDRGHIVRFKREHNLT